jgi:hypothetical protein
MNDVRGISQCSDSKFYSQCSRIKVAALSSDKKTVMLDTVVESHILSIVYRDIIYYPGIAKDGVLNLFRGYAAQEVASINSDSMDKVLYHVKVVLCNNDPLVYEYMLNWLACIIQTPRKVGVAILMIGPQGIGKNVFWEHFWVAHVLGLHNACVVPTLSDIATKFNAHISDKRFILVNDCKNASKHNHDALKVLITDRYSLIEKKGIDSIVQESYHCLAVCADNIQHEYIEPNDRRFMVIACSKEKRDAQYYNQLVAAKDECANEFYSFLKRRDISTFTPSVFPQTQMRTEIQEANINPVHQFIQEKPWEGWISASLIYSLYTEWCSSNGHIPVSNNRFKPSAGELINVKRGQKGNLYSIR